MQNETQSAVHLRTTGLQVGQRLWFVPSERRRGSPRWLTVEKIGRKWATLDSRERLNIETMFLDGQGFSSPGRCYLSEEHWQAEQERAAAWKALRDFVHARWAVPDGVSTEAIHQAAELIAPTPAGRCSTGGVE